MFHPPSRGIYILGNDRVLDHVRALVNSIRLHDARTPLCLIPYDDEHAGCASWIRSQGGTVFGDTGLLDFLSNWSRSIHEKRLADPAIAGKLNRMRKFAAWFGPFEEFAYIDADCVVFRDLTPFFRHLAAHDFLTHSGTDASKDVRYIFNESGRSLFPEHRLRFAFSSGFWLSRRGLFTRGMLEAALPEIRAASVGMDFDNVVDQPVINYLVLRHAQSIASIPELEDLPYASWAGAKGLQIKGLIAAHKGRPITFMHWAGSAKHSEGTLPLWEAYRDMAHTTEAVPQA